MKKALDYIIKGIPFGGKYKLSNESGYPAFRYQCLGLLIGMQKQL